MNSMEAPTLALHALSALPTQLTSVPAALTAVVCVCLACLWLVKSSLEADDWHKLPGPPSTFSSVYTSVAGEVSGGGTSKGSPLVQVQQPVTPAPAPSAAAAARLLTTPLAPRSSRRHGCTAFSKTTPGCTARAGCGASGWPTCVWWSCRRPRRCRRWSAVATTCQRRPSCTTASTRWVPFDCAAVTCRSSCMVVRRAAGAVPAVGDAAILERCSKVCLPSFCPAALQPQGHPLVLQHTQARLPAHQPACAACRRLCGLLSAAHTC